MTLSQAISRASNALDQAWKRSRITKPEIFEALKPLCRFTSAFVTEEEIKGDESSFNRHPDHLDPPMFGINGKGLSRLTAVTRGFWERRSQVALYQMVSLTECTPATEEEVERAIKLATSKVDMNAGEELTATARNLVISRAMPKQILSDHRLKHMVDLKQFYMAMREIDPDNLNKVHRSGSVPPVLAMTKGENTILRELLLLLLLLKDVPILDETAGDAPKKGKIQRPGYFAGSYHIVTTSGVLIPGAGKGIQGAVGVILFLLKDIEQLEYEYIQGIRETHKKDPPEKEYEQANCF